MIAERIPVSLVTGFLGSGKTTLIAALLKQPSMAGSAVIVNEIGAVGIDDAILAQSLDAGDVFLLANGCLCCAASDDLALTLWTLIRRPDRPRRVVVETSGLADPAPALRRVMADPRLRQAIRLDALIATIDAINGSRNLDGQPVASRQCAVADRRVITKSDIADAQSVERLRQRLLALNPGASVEVACHGAIDADKLFDASLFDPRSGHADLDNWLSLDRYRGLSTHQHGDRGFRGGPAHGSSIGTWLVEEPRPVDWTVLSRRLGDIVARHGDRLLRLKGVIRTAGDERPLVVHGVQRVFHSPVRLDRWVRTPMTSIVAIGDAGARPAIDAISRALADSVAAAPAGPSVLHGGQGFRPEDRREFGA
ncbi:MAG: GTP-binding protein [Methylobacteriaceae bacterium]|nr:GTP-binding protein [Methylobacteriaceae bacterium]